MCTTFKNVYLYRLLNFRQLFCAVWIVIFLFLNMFTKLDDNIVLQLKSNVYLLPYCFIFIHFKMCGLSLP